MSSRFRGQSPCPAEKILSAGTCCCLAAPVEGRGVTSASARSQCQTARISSVMPSARMGIPSERKKRSTALCTGETGCEKNFFEKSSKTGENRLQFADRYGILVKLIRKRKHSSAGRASALQAEGHRFEPCCFHQHSAESKIMRE